VKIIVLGAGNIGAYLSGILSLEGHDITVIDQNKERLERLIEKYDVSIQYGNGNDFSVLEKAGLKSADMIIAVTDVDEINIMVCFVAEKLGVKHKIARVRSNSYYYESLISMKELGVDLAINPEEIIANDLVNLILFPGAFEVAVFAEEKFMLQGFTISKSSPLKEMKIKDIVKNYPVFTDTVITMILRKGEVIIPHGDNQILPKDKVYIVAKTPLFKTLSPYFNEKYKPINKIFIVGANNVTALFVQKLRNKIKKIDLTIFDENINDCIELGTHVSKAKIVNADPTSEYDELVKEGLYDVDAFVSISNRQHINLLSAMIGKKAIVRKTIVSVVRHDIFSFYDATSIDSIVSLSLSSIGNIMRFVRKGNLTGVTPLSNKRAEMLEYKVTKKCKILNTPLKNAKLPANVIIAYIMRDNEIILPKGDSVLQTEDKVYLFTLTYSINELGRIFG
jgi:trk system potassium uptake protein